MTRKIALAVLLAVMAGPVLAQDSDSMIGPDYAPAPESVVAPDVPKGRVRELVLNSTDSKIYPGIVRVESEITARRDPYGNRMAAPAEQISAPGPYQRHVWVYIPSQYVPGTAAPSMVVQDGHSYLPRLQPVLDNMIAAHRIPPMIVIMADSGGSDAQGSERGLEYDTVSDRYSQWVEQELLPRVARDCNVRFTDNPEGRAAMGGSSGAAAAFTMAWFHPERYHRLLMYSGTFVNQASPTDPAYSRGAWEYHDHLVAAAPRKPLRIWMEVGEKDLHASDPEPSWHNWPLANQRMAKVLKDKGYSYRFVFAKEARHVDPRVIEQTLPGALEWLWAGYKS